MEYVEDIEASLTDLFDCPVCYEDMSKKQPKILQCGHSFCTTCLEKLHTEIDAIKCPTCRYQTSLPENQVSNLPANYVLEKLNQKMTGLLLEGRKMCGICLSQDIHSKATCSCVECQMNMCNSCKDYHVNIEIFRNHTFEDERFNRHLCKEHQTVISFVCLECRTGLCLRCTVHSDHKKHTDQIRDLDSGISTAKASLQSLLDSLSSALDHVTLNSDAIARNLPKHTLPKQCHQALTDIMHADNANFLTMWKHVNQKSLEAIELCRVLRAIQDKFLSQASAANSILTSTIVIKPWDNATEATRIPLVHVVTFAEEQGIQEPVEISFLSDKTVIVLDTMFNYASRLSMESGLVCNYTLPANEVISSVANDSRNIYICGEKNLMQIPFIYSANNPSSTTPLPAVGKIDQIMCQDDNTILLKTRNRLSSYERDTQLTTTVWEGNSATRYTYLSFYKSDLMLSYLITKPKKNEVLEQDIRGSRYYGQTELKEPRAHVAADGLLLVCDCQNHRVCGFDITNQRYLCDLLSSDDGIKWPTGISYQFPYLCITECNPGEAHGKIKFYKWEKRETS